MEDIGIIGVWSKLKLLNWDFFPVLGILENILMTIAYKLFIVFDDGVIFTYFKQFKSVLLH